MILWCAHISWQHQKHTTPSHAARLWPSSCNEKAHSGKCLTQPNRGKKLLKSSHQHLLCIMKDWSSLETRIRRCIKVAITDHKELIRMFEHIPFDCSCLPSKMSSFFFLIFFRWEDEEFHFFFIGVSARHLFVPQSHIQTHFGMQRLSGFECLSRSRQNIEDRPLLFFVTLPPSSGSCSGIPQTRLLFQT